MAKSVVNKFLGFGAAAVLVGGIGVAALAQGDPIMARQDLMKANGAQNKIITDYVKDGKGTIAEVQQAVATLKVSAGKIVALFPADSGMDKMAGKTWAQAEIWTDMQKFSDAAKKMADTADAFAAVVGGGDKARIEAAFATFGRDSCGTCHTPFRAPKT